MCPRPGQYSCCVQLSVSLLVFLSFAPVYTRSDHSVRYVHRL